MNLPDEEMAKFVTGTWLKRIGDIPLDEVAMAVCEDPGIVPTLVGALRHARKQIDDARKASLALCESINELGNAADDNDPAVMATAGPIGAAEAQLFIALDIYEQGFAIQRKALKP
jgi:hypothetical protein